MSTHPLGLDDHTDVYEACKKISAKWERLAVHLGVDRNSVEKMKNDCSGSDNSLIAVLDAWLRKNTTGIAENPSWKYLCECMVNIDRGIAESIAREHSCVCVRCCGVSLPLKRSLDSAEQQQLNTSLAEAVKHKNLEKIVEYAKGGGNPFCCESGTSRTIFSMTTENKEVFECLKSVYICHHHTGDHAVDILYPHYDEIYCRLKNPVQLFTMLHRESVIPDNVLFEATPRHCNLRECFIAAIEKAVRSNHCLLRVIGIVFQKHDHLFDIGESILQKYSQVFDFPPDLVASVDRLTGTFKIREKYGKIFGDFFGKRALLYDHIKEIMMKKKVSLKQLKYFLVLYDQNLENKIIRCKSMPEVVKVIRRNMSIANTSLMESVAIRFKLDEVLKLLNDYNRELADFCKAIKIEHCYGLEFMDCYEHNRLSSDEVKFVLDWAPGDETIDDIRCMLRCAFDDLANHISIVVVKASNSVAVICFIPAQYRTAFARIVNQNRAVLEKEKVLSITLGECVLFERHVERKEVLPVTEDLEGHVLADLGDNDDHSLTAVSTDTIPEVDTLHESQSELTEVPKESPLKDQLAEGMLSIKPDWDEQTDVTSGYVSMKPDSDRQTVASGDIGGGNIAIVLRSGFFTLISYTNIHVDRRLVELQDDVTLKEAIDTYERVVRKLLLEKKSIESQLATERELKIRTCMELDQIKAQLSQCLMSKVLSAEQDRGGDVKLLQVQQVLTKRDETIQTMREDIRRLQQRINGLDVKTQLSYAKQNDLDNKLLEATKRNSTKDVEVCLSAGANINTTAGSRNQHTPLHLASVEGHQNVVETLVNHGAVIEAEDKDQRTPLHLASERGHQNVVETLINHGAVIEAKHEYQRTPLHLASVEGHQNVVETLVNHGAVIEAKDNYQRTPLHLASVEGHQNVVETLVNHGAVIEAKDEIQYTPLHLASRNGYQNVVETLINHGAVIEAKDKRGQSPLHLALLFKHPTVAVLLISSGADIYKEDKWGQSPVLIASVFNYKVVLKLFLSQGVSADTLQKYYLPPGWKAEGSWSLYRIQYTNTDSGLKQDHHPNFSK